MPENDRIIKLFENSHGVITLFHDFDRGTQKKESWVLESVQLALLRAREKNMNIVTVFEII